MSSPTQLAIVRHLGQSDIANNLVFLVMTCGSQSKPNSNVLTHSGKFCVTEVYTIPMLGHHVRVQSFL